MNGALAELAEKTLGELLPLLPAERRMLAAAEAGCPDVGAGADADAEADGRIRPEVVRWLCTHPGAARRVAPEGVHVAHARLDQPLDLTRAAVAFPLTFTGCSLLPGLILRDATIHGLTLENCQVGPVRCDGLNARGAVRLEGGTRVLGGVRLAGATVLGDLSLAGAALLNGGGVALAAPRLAVEGDLLLVDGFTALGSVRLIDAAVAGDMDCRGGRFLNRGGTALAADRIQVGGRTWLEPGFRAYGAVRLLDARVAGGTRGRHATPDSRAARTPLADGPDGA